MIEVIRETYDQKMWNEAAGHPLQSWEWGEARQAMGIDILRLGVTKGAQLTAVYLIMLHRIPFSPYRVGYIPRSPLPSNEITDFLLEYGKTNTIISYQFEPDVRKNESPVIPPHLVASVNPLFPSHTQILDITPAESKLMDAMKPKTRYNIRLAQRRGVTVEEVKGDEGFAIFAKLYFDTTKRQRYFGHNYMYHKTNYDTLKDKIAHILVAEYKGKPLAAYELFLFGSKLYYPYGGSSSEHKEVMAANLLMWEAIKFGKKHSAKSFDMWGSLAPGYDASDPWSGFTRFKEGYGSTITEMIGSYDLVVNPLLYTLFSTAYKLRGKFL